MKFALIADSHGAKDRLKQAILKIDELKINTVIHAGDLINYDVEKIFAEFPHINFYISLGNCDVNIEIINQIKKLRNCQIDKIINL